MQEKFVLETTVVKDLIQYHKDRKLKINNNVNIKKVYDYLNSIEFDGISILQYIFRYLHSNSFKFYWYYGIWHQK